jgi:hypothetical protein
VRSPSSRVIADIAVIGRARRTQERKPFSQQRSMPMVSKTPWTPKLRHPMSAMTAVSAIPAILWHRRCPHDMTRAIGHELYRVNLPPLRSAAAIETQQAADGLQLGQASRDSALQVRHDFSYQAMMLVRQRTDT